MSLSAPSGSGGPTASNAAVLSMLEKRGVRFPPYFPRLPIKVLKGGHRSNVRGLGWSIDGRKLATCGMGGLVRIWVPERSIDYRASTELKGHSESVEQLAWHPLNPDVLATASSDRTVRVWDTRAKTKEAGQTATDSASSLPGSVQVIETPGSNINIAYHPSGDYLAVGDKNDNISIIDVRQGKVVHTVCSRKDAATGVGAASLPSTSTTIWSNKEEINELCWSPNGELLILSSNDGTFHLHNSTDYARVHTVRAHTTTTYCVQWDPYSRYLASGSGDSMVGLWDTREWFCHKMISSHEGMIKGVSFSHDGELLAAGGDDNFVTISATCPYPPGEDDLLYKIPLPPRMNINCLAWHPSKYILAYAGDEGGPDVGAVRIYGL